MEPSDHVQFCQYFDFFVFRDVFTLPLDNKTIVNLIKLKSHRKNLIHTKCNFGRFVSVTVLLALCQSLKIHQMVVGHLANDFVL